MIAIRGAITVDSDTPEEIKGAVKDLLCSIKEKNNLSQDDVVCIMLSSTQDIHSFYPAKAAREAGFDGCALFSSAEPDIEGSLPLCIRVMLLCDGKFKPCHVYLRGAALLRKDLTSRLVVALDGPAGSGKSTAAKALAKHFNILYLDTGAMYRACALKCLGCGTPLDDGNAVKKVIDSIDLKIEYDCGRQVTILDGKDVSEEIRKPEVSSLASRVSAFPCVREKMVEMQRKIASSMSCVVDGRDIGTNVLPDCEHKFYITASTSVRANRRFLEEKAKGYETSLESVEADIIARDKRDTEREVAPLRKAKDAVLVDTSDMTEKQVLEYLVNKIQEKI
ncbi:MAG: (d)CMP kinase [Clostridia bacterium]|nr:(d)CMP kinase [Clostridia bacterium]